MSTLSLDNYGVVEMDANMARETDGGCIIVGLGSVVLGVVEDINKAWSSLVKGFETCKCHTEK